MSRYILFFLFCYITTFADYVIETAQKTKIFVSDEFILEDTSNTLDICEVSSDKFKNQFYKSEYATGWVKKINATYWLRFKVRNYTEKPIVFHREATFSNIRMWHEIAKGDFKELPQFYNDLDFNLFLLKRHEYIFQSSFYPKEQTYYLQFKPLSYQFIGITIDSFDAFFIGSINQTFYYSFFFGIIFIIFIYNMIIGIKSNELIYIFYAIYVISLGIYAAGVWFIIPMNLFDYHWFMSVYNIPYSIMTIALLAYTKYFFKTSETLKVENIFLISFISFKMVLVMGQIFIIPTGLLYSNNIDMIMLLFAFFIGFRMYFKGFKPARFHLLGFTVIITGFIGYWYQKDILKLLNFPDFGSFFENYLYNAGIIEILLFSLSLSDRYRILKMEAIKSQNDLIENLKLTEKLKDEKNKDLEQKVQERTLTIRKQSLEIARINSILRNSNLNLKSNLKKAESARVENRLLSFIEFIQAYPNEDSCKQLLAQIKWSEGFECKKCKNDKYSLLKDNFSRRCTKCSYVESPTNGTILNNVKFDLIKALYLIYIANSGKKMTIEKLSSDLELRKQTCIEFNKRIKLLIDSLPKRKRNLDDWKKLIVLPLESKTHNVITSQV
ncbi:MAG: 7TM diverse intracellular signaling domain-containing protein [Bacteroidota bacterium]|nr:7TM diverse intracellular signaling domain-containing protein [Bacteroidota bacterium]